MAEERVKLNVSERERRGSSDARRLRRQGLVPGVLYGRGNKPHAICLPERELRRALTGGHGLHAILDVVIDGQKTTRSSILKDYQQEPVRGRLLHVDLQEVRLDQPIQATVTVTLIGGEDSPGVREGGVLAPGVRELTVEALPMEVPEHIDVDVAGMAIGDTLRLADLPPIENVRFVDDPDETVVASVMAPTRVVEPEETPEEAAEAAEGAPAAEQAPTSATEEPGDAGGDAAGSPGTTPG